MSRTLDGEKPNVTDQRALVLVLSHNPRALVARAQSYLILRNLFSIPIKIADIILQLADFPSQLLCH